MFYKIPGLSDNQYLIYAYITYIFYGMMYTGINIPYGSLASVITDDEVERSSLSMWRSVGAGIGGLPAQILLPLVVYSTVMGADGSTAKVLNGTKLSIAVGALAVLSVIIIITHYKLTTERIQLPPTQKASDYSLFKTIKIMFKNKPFIVLCLISMLLIGFQMYTQTIYNYLFKTYFDKPGLYSLVTVCTYLPMALFLPFMNKLIRKYGKKEICAAGLLFAAIVNILMLTLRFSALSENPYIFLILVFFSGAGQTFLVLEVWALVMDVTDYQEILSRFGSEAMVNRFAISFLNDPSFEQLKEGLEENDGEKAFRAAHTLKGVCLNLGFNGLNELSSELTEKLRGHSTEGTEPLFEAVKEKYESMIETIRELQNEG